MFAHIICSANWSARFFCKRNPRGRLARDRSRWEPRLRRAGEVLNVSNKNKQRKMGPSCYPEWVKGTVTQFDTVWWNPDVTLMRCGWTRCCRRSRAAECVSRWCIQALFQVSVAFILSPPNLPTSLSSVRFLNALFKTNAMSPCLCQLVYPYVATSKEETICTNTSRWWPHYLRREKKAAARVSCFTLTSSLLPS